MGLGLSICKNIAEAFGGSIQVQSNVQTSKAKGTTFTFTVKCLEAEESIDNNEFNEHDKCINRQEEVDKKIVEKYHRRELTENNYGEEYNLVSDEESSCFTSRKLSTLNLGAEISQMNHL